MLTRIEVESYKIKIYSRETGLKSNFLPLLDALNFK